MPLFPLLEELYENTLALGIFAKSAGTHSVPPATPEAYIEDADNIGSDPSETGSNEQERTNLKRLKTKLDFKTPEGFQSSAQPPKKRILENGTTKLANKLVEMNGLVALEKMESQLPDRLLSCALRK
jgi:hypothetical protein